MEFNAPIWSTYLKQYFNKTESKQPKFTRLICNRFNIPNILYQERLTKLGLNFLEYRRWEFYLITLIKIINVLLNVFFFNFCQRNQVLTVNIIKITFKHDFKKWPMAKTIFHKTMIL